jgi:uncharacterized coiled-coil DUF342 family protein
VCRGDRLRQEREKARGLRQDFADLQETNRRLSDDNRRLLEKARGAARAEQRKCVQPRPTPGATERDLQQQIVALKWRLVEATRRAEVAEATLIRHGLFALGKF